MTEDGKEVKQSVIETLRTAAFSKSHSPLTRLIYFLFGKVLQVGLVASFAAGLLVIAFSQGDVASFITNTWNIYVLSVSIAKLLQISLVFLLITFIDTLSSSLSLLIAKIDADRVIIDKLKMENLAKDKVILNQFESSRIDHRTQIPNEQAFDYDLVEIAKPGIVGIMIDIVEFGNFNNTYNHLHGDELLKKIAQYLFLNSRRSERVFRFSERREGDPDTIIQIGDYGSAYRLHRKGDEFIVILNGDEVDALGFLNRLRRKFSNENSEIYKVGGKVILFYASVVEISVETTPKEFLRNLSDSLVIAKRNAKFGESRVVTLSNNNYKELKRNRDENESEEDFIRRRNLYKQFQTTNEWKGKSA